MSIEITPVAYKYKAKKDGIINEFITIKEISEKDAEKKIKDFLEYFKIIGIRKEILGESKEEIKQEFKGKESSESSESSSSFSTTPERFTYIVEFMKKFPEFIKKDYVDFIISKGLKFKSTARANDDFNVLKEQGFLERVPPHGWKFICSEESLNSFVEMGRKRFNKVVPQATGPDQDQRTYMMIKNMKDKEYFTFRDWLDFMTTPPNNFDEKKIGNNFYHDIIHLKGKVEEIMMDGVSYKPKRFKVIKVEPQEVEERMIKDLNEGQKVLLGTIKE